MGTSGPSLTTPTQSSLCLMSDEESSVPPWSISGDQCSLLLWEALSYLCGALFSLPISLGVRKSFWKSHLFSALLSQLRAGEKHNCAFSLLKRVSYKGCEDGIRAQKTRMETGTGGAGNVVCLLPGFPGQGAAFSVPRIPSPLHSGSCSIFLLATHFCPPEVMWPPPTLHPR